MIRDEVVSLLARRLNNRTDIDTDIITEMQLVQATVLEQNGRFLPWFLMTEQALEVTDVGENRVRVPDDFLAEVEGQRIWIQNPTTLEWLKLAKDDEMTLEEEYGTATGLPEKYAIAGDHFTLFPTPDSNYSIRLRYAAKATGLDTNVENAWLQYAPDLLIAYVGRNLAKTLLQNPELAAQFGDQVQPGWDRLLAMHELREDTNQDYRMGGEG